MVIRTVNFYQAIGWASICVPCKRRHTCIFAFVMPLVQIPSPREHKLLSLTLYGVVFSSVVPMVQGSGKDVIEASGGHKSFVGWVSWR